MTRARGYAGICFVLCALVAALDLQLVVGPDLRRDVWQDGREAAAETFAADALQHELRRLRDGRGVIPPNAYGRARTQLEVLKRRRAARRLVLGNVAPIGPQAPGASAATSAAAVTSSQWRWLGPGNIGGRVRSIAIDPTNPSILYAGSVGGGVWKTTNGGGSWFPLDDFMAVLSVSSLVIDPAHPQILYAGTGEGFGNADGIFGAGIFKTTDGGTTWTQLSETSTWQVVNRLAISRDGATLLAATNMGIFRSANGGTFSARGTPDVQDVVFDPNDNNHSVAAGPVGPIYSWDGGLNWQSATGLPKGGRIELAWARSSPNVVFASVAVNSGVLYRSNDGGATYSAVYTAGNLLGPQGWYDNAIWVNPRNGNHLLIGGVSVRESLDGGATWRLPNLPMHADQHAIVEDPRFDGTTNRTVYFGNDGGVFRMPDVAVDGASSVQNLNNNLGVTQFYAGAGNAATGVILGGTQDNGTVVLSAGGGTSGWRQTLCCDGGYAAVDPMSSFIYGSIYYLSIYRSSDAGNSWRLITSALPESGIYANFVAPFVLDPHNPAVILAGGASLWRTENATADIPTWKQIIGFGGRPYFNAIAIAPNDSNVVWAARDASPVVYKATNATAATPSFFALTVPNDGKLITQIAISPADSNVVYITTGGFTSNNILKTNDGGATWLVATGSGASGLPPSPINDLAIDPTDPNTIYAASDVGVFVSSDGGSTWDLPQDGPANVRVDQLFWMGRTLVAATHGRGMFAVDTSTTAPSVGISPAALDFGQQRVGTSSAPRTITVTDTGSAALTIAGVSLAGSNPSQFAIATDGCTGRTLAPGEVCSVDVVFRPTTATTSSATFVVQSNAASSRETSTISGTGVAATTGALPSPWANQDIGAVGVAGSAGFANGTFTVAGSGGDIWDSADAFQHVYQPISGDSTIVARVATVQNANKWTKAGVMMRASPDAASPHVSVFVTPGKGIAFQYRTTSGATSTSVSAAGAAPEWVKLTRAGDLITGSYSADGSSWTAIGQQTVSLGAGILAGLAVTSHDNTQTADATFDNVAVTPASSMLPAGWQTSDVGSVGIAGSGGESGGTFTLTGSGADIWDTADAFRYAYSQMVGDGAIVARVAAVENVHAWTKAGVMIRQTLDAGSAHASMLVTPGKGLAFQRRLTAGATSLSTSVGGAAPYWVKLARADQTITASISSDGSAWILVGQDTVALGGPVWIGLALASHDNTRAATATIDNVRVITGLPAGWQDADVGSTSVAGSASESNGVFTVKGSGADVWGTADAFHFVYRSLSGDGQLVARVASVQNTHRWAKAGVMIRQTLSAAAPEAMMLVSASAGMSFQYRTSSSGSSINVSGTTAVAPMWVKIVRSGDTIAGYQSSDGASWQLVGTVTIAMGSSVQIGLAVTSHNDAELCQAVFESVGF